MRTPRGRSLPVLLAGLAIGLLYASPFLGDAIRHGLSWPVRLAGEGPSLTTYGRWWILPPHRYLADGFSGDFPTFYNYLSDALLNALAVPFDWAPMTVQAVLYGPLLGALFFWLNHAAVRAVTGDRWTAFLASLIVSLGGDSGLPHLLPGVDTEVLDRTLHVPFHTLSLGTAQSLGWLLFLPCLALLHLGRERFTVARAAGFGACTGLLFHAHTLTFLNVAFAQLVYLTVVNAGELVGKKRRLWAAGIGAIVLAFAARAALGGPLTSGVLVVFGAAALATDFLFDEHRRLYLWGYGTAVLVSAPYALALVRDLAGASRIEEQGNPAAVAPLLVLAFFAPLVLAAACAIAYAPEAGVQRWLFSVLGATAFLAVNHLWSWGNHPYRFAIDLLFPLAVLAALGLRHAPRAAALPLALWIFGGLVANVAGFARGPRLYVSAPPVLPTTARFLKDVRDTTAAAGPSARILNPPEFFYPFGLTQNALLFNYARVPGFIPDYRYLLSRERYFNRLGLFCFLFPGFPAFDHHLDRRACTETLEPPPGFLAMREPRLRAAILPAYGIAFAAASGPPFGPYLAEAQTRYGWPTLAEGDERRRLVRVGPPDLPGLAAFTRATDEGRSVGFRTAAAGPHVVVLGGRGLDRRAPRVLVDGQELAGRREGNWAVLRGQILAGDHRLDLPPPGLDRDGERDVLFFAAVVHARWAEEYLGLPTSLPE